MSGQKYRKELSTGVDAKTCQNPGVSIVAQRYEPAIRVSFIIFTEIVAMGLFFPIVSMVSKSEGRRSFSLFQFFTAALDIQKRFGEIQIGFANVIIAGAFGMVISLILAGIALINTWGRIDEKSGVNFAAGAAICGVIGLVTVGVGSYCHDLGMTTWTFILLFIYIIAFALTFISPIGEEKA